MAKYRVKATIGDVANRTTHGKFHATNDDRILSCGHKPSPHTEHTTGTAHMPDGREICWTCADAAQVADMATSDRFMAYLSEDGKALQTWSGGTLARIVSLRQTPHNIGGWLYRFNAIDVHGNAWYGTSPGKGMYARMRRNKVRVK